METIYTIPVNEAFEASAADKSCGCPICALYNKLEEDELDLILGASMMEPDVRVKTNEQGFCEKHLELLQDTIWEICDLYVWALPAHIENIEVNDNCELDLDATTMAMALAMIKVMLGDRLHPLIKSNLFTCK